MKKLFLFSLLISQFAFSQTEKGKFIISGSTSTELSFINNKFDGGNFSNKQKITSFDIKPSIGYFVLDHLFIGISGLYDFEHINNNRANIIENNLLTLMPLAGYYFMPDSKIRPFVVGGIGYTNLKNKFESNNNIFDPLDPGFSSSDEISYHGVTFGIATGLGYFVTKNFSIDAQLSYNYLNLNNKNNDLKSETSGIGFRVGFSVFL